MLYVKINRFGAYILNDSPEITDLSFFYVALTAQEMQDFLEEKHPGVPVNWNINA